MEKILEKITVTRRPPALSRVQTELKGISPGRSGVYQLARFVQLDEKTAGFFVNIRQDQAETYDLELGTDFCFTRDPDLRRFEGFQVLTRAEKVHVPETGKSFLMVSYPLFAAFVPLGALLEDGTPHPHAGTGFALGIRLGRPCDAEGNCKGCTDPLEDDSYDDVEILQLAWDGENLSITGKEHKTFFHKPGDLENSADPRPPLAGVVSDGEDLLTGLTRRIGNEKIRRAGVCRWQRRNGVWQIAGFTPIGAPGSMEPSLIRDRDGTLLYTHRTGVKQWTPELKNSPEGLTDSDNCRDLRVWSSSDNGHTWKACFQEKDCCNAAPVSIAMTCSGKAVLLTNPFEDVLNSGERIFHGAIREKMGLWPLNDDRNGVLPCLIIRDTIEEFSLPPYGRGWYFDHPVSQIIRLGDGKWHCAVTFRNLDISEGGGGKKATAFTGLYVEKIITPADDDFEPPWRF